MLLPRACFLNFRLKKLQFCFLCFFLFLHTFEENEKQGNQESTHLHVQPCLQQLTKEWSVDGTITEMVKHVWKDTFVLHSILIVFVRFKWIHKNYMYLYMHICFYVHTYIYIYTYIYICTYMCCIATRLRRRPFSLWSHTRSQSLRSFQVCCSLSSRKCVAHSLSSRTYLIACFFATPCLPSLQRDFPRQCIFTNVMWFEDEDKVVTPLSTSWIPHSRRQTGIFL